MGAAAAGVPPKPELHQPVQRKRPAHLLWAMLIARLCDVFRLMCPIGGGQIRIFAFIPYSADLRKVVQHVRAGWPRTTPSHGLPLWDEADEQVGQGVQALPSRH